MRPHPHPYQHLPPERYWRTGVAARPTEAYDGLWTPRFPIGPQTRFATAGSCFAQHISRWLQRNGYAWVDAEPAPAGLDAAAREAGGWGVFSHRTGNVYTAALLRQWVRWALGHATMPDDLVQDGDVWRDPFRPHVPAAGHASPEALRAARDHTLRCMRASFAQTDVFVFTLGLTESWVHRDGPVYPLCPGTTCGAFDPALHHFVNQGFDSICRDLHDTFDLLRSCNPAMRFLLTVSPVPLTATATADHVLVATTRAKSVLRAAAGALRDQRDDVDYFPSYELIASFASRGRWFDTNLRSVLPEGVDQVMAHFGRALQGAAPVLSAAASPARLPPPSRPAASANADGAATAEEALFCEDLLLERFQAPATLPGLAGAGAAPLCLLGDSHMGKLAAALAAQGVPHCGGMVMWGSAWFANRFAADEQDLFVPLAGRASRACWAEVLPWLDQPTAAAKAPLQVITNLGMQTHVAVPALLAWYRQRHGHLTLDAAEVARHYRDTHRERLAILARLLARGVRVRVITDPPTQALNPDLRAMLPAFESFDLVACHVLRQMGCEVFHARAHFAAAGWPAGFYSDETDAQGRRDWLHGSPAYYDQLARLLLADGGNAAAAAGAAPVAAAPGAPRRRPEPALI